jgi:hypothetical protein
LASPNKTLPSPLVKYVYEVDGQEFSNDSYYPKHLQKPPSGTLEWASAEANKFADDINVYYNPANPTDSFIEFPSKSPAYFIGIGSTFVLLVAIFYLLFGIDNFFGNFNNR